MTPEEMLLLTLRFYATGCIHKVSGDFAGVSSSTACRVVRKVSHHIALLRPNFISLPLDRDMQKQYQRQFYSIAKFPQVLAAIDCTHVRIISPG